MTMFIESTAISRMGYRKRITPPPPEPFAGEPMSVRDFTRKHNAGVISRARRGANVAAFRFLDEHGFSRISEALLQLHNEIRAGDVRLSLRAGMARETIVVVVASIAEREMELVLHFPSTGAMAWFDSYTLRAAEPHSAFADEFISELKLRIRRFFRTALAPSGAPTSH